MSRCAHRTARLGPHKPPPLLHSRPPLLSAFVATSCFSSSSRPAAPSLPVSAPPGGLILKLPAFSTIPSTSGATVHLQCSAVLRGAGASRDKFEGLFARFLFAYDNSLAIELHILEGLLAPFVFVSDQLSMSDQQPEFGHAALDPAFLYGVFERLVALGLDTSAASDGVVRARLAKARQDFASEFADDDRFRVKIEHFIPLEGVYDGGGSPFLYGRPAGDALAPGARWLAELNIITLADDAECLSPYGDLALLVGGRASLTAKRGANGRFRTVGDRFAQAAATANSMAVGPAESCGDDVAFFIAARPWPIPLLGGLPTISRAVRDPGDRRRFFDGELAVRGAVVRERFGTVLTRVSTTARSSSSSSARRLR